MPSSRCEIPKDLFWRIASDAARVHRTNPFDDARQTDWLEVFPSSHSLTNRIEIHNILAFAG